MGSTTSCCVSASPKFRRNAHSRLESDQQESDLSREETGCNLQHISDRENIDDLNIEYNPSEQGKASTIFLSRSQNEVQEKRKGFFINNHGPVRRKYSSCSTIFLDENTVSRPSLKYTIKCVALAIYYHIKNRDKNVGMLLEIFDEKLHPLSAEDPNGKVNPKRGSVFGPGENLPCVSDHSQKEKKRSHRAGSTESLQLST